MGEQLGRKIRGGAHQRVAGLVVDGVELLLGNAQLDLSVALDALGGGVAPHGATVGESGAASSAPRAKKIRESRRNDEAGSPA